MPPDKQDSMQIVSHSPEDTQSIGRILGELAAPGDVYLLVGDLGAGKTCLTQGILWGLGTDEFARSPTFVLVSQYQGRMTMYHMDLYRLDSFDEILDLGLDEFLFGDGISVVEWAEKALGAFPENHMLIQIQYIDEDTRRLTLNAFGQRYSEILSEVSNARTGSEAK